MQLPLLETLSPRPTGMDSGPKSIGAVRVLRISVTDRCNYRCVYCMPEAGVRWLDKDRILSFEEIEAIVRAAIDVHGIRRFKLTGGEPTVRHGVVDLVRRLRRINGIEDLSMTTNGQRLLDLAGPLKESGLDRVTVSIDSLNDEKFRRITRTGSLRDVMAGLDRAHDVGFESLKINCVTMRGVNDDEFVDFARLTLSRRFTVRFIEYMPLGDAALMDGPTATPERIGDAKKINFDAAVAHVASTSDRLPLFARGRISEQEIGPAAGCGAQDRGAGSLVPEGEVRSVIEAALGPMERIDPKSEAGVGPAVVYRLVNDNAIGRIGFISAMSSPFCESCNRLRLTADGLLRSCLFEGGEVDVKPILRKHSGTRGQLAAQLAAAMSECVRLKPDVHSRHGNQQMSRIGG